MGDFELVYRIESIELVPTGDPPVHYQIKAEGKARQPGYQQPMLIIRSRRPDALGNLTYYFAAEPPVGGTGDPVTIKASRYLYDLVGVKRITIVAETNELYRGVP